MVEQKITAIMIVEVAGRPPEYLTNSLQLHIDKLNHVKGVKLVSSKLSEPAVVESEKDLYTCFAEVEVEVVGLSKLMDLVFDFMPSSIEIIDPMNLDLNCQEATMFVNDLAGRLHKYDELAKIAKMQLMEMSKKLEQIQPKQASEENANPFQPIRITMQNDKLAKEKIPAKKQKKKKK